MKLNFFSRIYLAITDFRLYPFIVQKEKFISAIAYFICFILLVSAILTTGVTTKILRWTNEFMSVYNEQISEFSIESGELILEKNMNFEFYGVQIFADDNIVSDDFSFESFESKDCDVSILGLKDGLAFGSENIGFVLLKYSDSGLSFDKDDVYNFFEDSLKNPMFLLTFVFSIFGGVFVAYLLTKFMNVLGISIMLLFLGMVFRTKYKFKDYMKVACYVITLPIITEILALIMTGSISEYAYITYYLLVYVYMYYAIRALKLDDIIMTTQEKLFGVRKNDSDVTKTNEEKENGNTDESQNDDENK